MPISNTSQVLTTVLNWKVVFGRKEVVNRLEIVKVASDKVRASSNVAVSTENTTVDSVPHARRFADGLNICRVVETAATSFRAISLVEIKLNFLNSAGKLKVFLV